MDRAHEALFLAKCCHTTTACTEVRVVVGAIKQVCHTAFL